MADAWADDMSEHTLLAPAAPTAGAAPPTDVDAGAVAAGEPLACAAGGGVVPGAALPVVVFGPHALADSSTAASPAAISSPVLCMIFLRIGPSAASVQGVEHRPGQCLGCLLAA